MMAMSALQSPTVVNRARSTNNIEQFAECFTQAEDEAHRSWAFVPTGSGGMFTNLGAIGSGAPYRLLIRAADGGSSLRLIADRPNPELRSTMEKCR